MDEPLRNLESDFQNLLDQKSASLVAEDDDLAAAETVVELLDVPTLNEKEGNDTTTFPTARTGRNTMAMFESEFFSQDKAAEDLSRVPNGIENITQTQNQDQNSEDGDDITKTSSKESPQPCDTETSSHKQDEQESENNTMNPNDETKAESKTSMSGGGNNYGSGDDFEVKGNDDGDENSSYLSNRGGGDGGRVPSSHSPVPSPKISPVKSPKSISKKQRFLMKMRGQNVESIYDNKELHFEEEVGEWPYKAWVLNSLEIIHEMELEAKVYVEAQLGRVSKERRFMPLETTASVMFAESTGDGANFGMEGASHRFREVMAHADKQLGPHHPLSISAAADLGDCLSQLGDCSEWPEAERVLRRVLKYRERQDEKEHAHANHLIHSAYENVDHAVEHEIKEGKDMKLWGERSIVAGLALSELLRKMKRPLEAIPLARKAVASSEELFGRQNKQTLIAMRSLATSLLFAGQISAKQSKIDAESFTSESEKIFKQAGLEEEKLYGLNAESTKACISGVANSIFTASHACKSNEFRVHEAMRYANQIGNLPEPAQDENTISAKMKKFKKQVSDLSTMESFKNKTSSLADTSGAVRVNNNENNSVSTQDLLISWCLSIIFPHPNSVNSKNARALALTAPVFLSLLALRVSLDQSLWDNFTLLDDIYQWFTVVVPNLALFTAFSALALCLGLMGVAGIKHYTAERESPTEKDLILKILLLPPLLALSAVAALLVEQPLSNDQSSHDHHTTSQNAAHLLEMCTQVYEALVVHEFLELMFCFTDVARDSIPPRIRGRPVHFIFPLNLIWNHVEFDESLVAKLESWTKQYVVVKTLETIVRGYLVDRLGYGSLSIYCDAALFISTTFSMGALVGFYHTYAEELAPHHPLRKFVAIKLIVLICSYQKWMFALVSAMGFPNELVSHGLTAISPYLVLFGLLPPLPEEVESEVWEVKYNVNDLPCLYPDRYCNSHIALHQLNAWLTVMESGFIFATVFYYAFNVEALASLDMTRQAKKMLPFAASIATFRKEKENIEEKN